VAGEAEPKRILIADDEINIRRVLEAILKRDGYDVVTAANGEEALLGMGRGVHTVITDLKMPGLDGMALLKRLASEHPDVPVVMITAHGSVENAVEAVKLGAFDYVEKPFDQDQIRQIVAKALRTHALSRRDARPEEVKGRGRFRLVGDSAAIRHIYAIIEKVADTPSTVLITGESGTGKELIARALHENSSRHAGPFIKINCAAIPKTLMESELFGYEKGAFTGRWAPSPDASSWPTGHAVPRRDRRDPGRDAGQAPARPAGVGVRARRRHQDHQGRRAPGDRHQPRSGGRAGRRRLPRRSLLPPQRGAHPSAAVA
jgi:DNA-binding NtrC family response regulator